MIIFHHFLNDIFSMTFKKWSCKLKKMTKTDEKICHLKIRHVLLYHILSFQISYSNWVSWKEETYYSACAKTWMNGSSFLLYLHLRTNIFMNKNRIVAASFMFAGIESRIFVFVLVMSSWISPKISSKSCGVMCRSLLYSESSSNFSFCTSVCLD